MFGLNRIEFASYRSKDARLLCSAGFVDSGYGYGSLAAHTEVPGTCIEVLQDSQKFRVRVLTELTEGPGTGMQVLHNSQYFRVGIRMLCSYPGHCGTGVQNLQKFRVRV